jgi:hypothetical protein
VATALQEDADAIVAALGLTDEWLGIAVDIDDKNVARARATVKSLLVSGSSAV